MSPASLVWISNVPDSYVTGEHEFLGLPKATEFHSAEQLAKSGVIGLYVGREEE